VAVFVFTALFLMALFPIISLLHLQLEKLHQRGHLGLRRGAPSRGAVIAGWTEVGRGFETG
jgi:hypothetical protein